jgi:hypothetical protein
VGKVRASEPETGPTITAVPEGGPLGGRRLEVDVVEGGPPKPIDAHADDGSTCRYCPTDWAQTGPSAVYAFLHRAQPVSRSAGQPVSEGYHSFVPPVTASEIRRPALPRWTTAANDAA